MVKTRHVYCIVADLTGELYGVFKHRIDAKAYLDKIGSIPGLVIEKWVLK